VIEPIIADTGVIVAFLSKKDQWREWTHQQMRNLPIPFLTCEAVITEACYLMRKTPNGKQDVLKIVADGVLQIKFSLAEEANAVKALIDKYNDVPMDFADACVVRMSELIENSVVFTIDDDFRIYRKNDKEKISLIIPDMAIR